MSASAAPRRLLLTGATGQVGWELRRTLAPLGEVIAPTRAEADLADAEALGDLVLRLRPHAVVNAAAYTAVDRAESEPDLARAVNARAPGALAAAAAEVGCPLVHFSTDYVFDGAGDRPYRETDAAAPLNVYGRSKLEGERAVAAAGGRWIVLRTSWVYGLRGRNFLRTVLRLAAERGELTVVDDQRGAPTWSRALAEAAAQILARCARADGFDLPDGTGGIYHLAAAGETTWYGFARAVLELAPGAPDASVRPIPTAGFPTPARRPALSLLDCSRVERDFRLRLPHWRAQLELCLASAT